MAAGNMWKQGAVGSGGRRRQKCLTMTLSRGKARCDQPNGSRFHIAFTAGDLAGEAPAWISLHPQRVVEQFGRIEESVAVKAAEPGEFRILQAGNAAEDAYLLGVFQFGLEADHIEQRAELVILA